MADTAGQGDAVRGVAAGNNTCGCTAPCPGGSTCRYLSYLHTFNQVTFIIFNYISLINAFLIRFLSSQRKQNSVDDNN